MSAYVLLNVRIYCKYSVNVFQSFRRGPLLNIYHPRKIKALLLYLLLSNELRKKDKMRDSVYCKIIKILDIWLNAFSKENLAVNLTKRKL